MTKVIECSSNFFGDLLFYGLIDMYSGYLNPDYRSFDDDEDEDTDIDRDRFADYKDSANSLLKDFFEGTVFERYFKPMGFTKLNYIKLYQPEWYNYYGDHVEFELEYKGDFVEWAVQFLNDCRGGDCDVLIEKWLWDNYSSYSGFCSLTPNDIPSLIEALQANDDDLDKYRGLNAFIAAYLYNKIESGEIEKLGEDNLIHEVVENLYY